MKISVIIPIYNVENFIERCLDSVLAQTMTDYEIICVDDCGTDHSMDIVRRYAAANPQIRIIESDCNVGLGAARDKAIAVAQGEYLTFIDSDDYIKEDFLERYLMEAECTHADVVVGGYDRTDGQKHTLYEVRSDDALFLWTHPSAWAKIYRRAYLAEYDLNFMGVRRNEDERFQFRVLQYGPSVAQIPYVGYYYWINQDSLTMQKDVDRTEYVESYLETARETYELKPYREEERELFAYCFVSYLNAAVLYYGRGCGTARMKELYAAYDALVRQFPDICSNRYIRMSQLKSETRNNRFASWMVLRFRRFGWDKMLFLLDSRI